MKNKKANLGIRAILTAGALFGAINNANASEKGVLKLVGKSPSVSSPPVVLMNWPDTLEGYDLVADKSYPYELYFVPVIDFYMDTDFSGDYDMLRQEGHPPESMTSFYGVLSGRNLPEPNALTKISAELLVPERYTIDHVKAVWDVYERKMNNDANSLEDEPYVYEHYGSGNVKALADSKYEIPFVVNETIGAPRTDFHYPHYRWEVKFRDRNDWAGADSSLDDFVNMPDFANVSKFYGTDCESMEKGTKDCYECYNSDTNLDNVVDILDLEKMANHWLNGIR